MHLGAGIVLAEGMLEGGEPLACWFRPDDLLGQGTKVSGVPSERYMSIINSQACCQEEMWPFRIDFVQHSKQTGA